MLGNYVAPIPAQQRIDKSWYLGSADAIFQSLNTITDEKPDIVVVVGADHVYRMDFSPDGRAAHRVGRRGAPWPRSGSRSRCRPVRRHRRRARRPAQDPAFLEKPTDPEGLPDSPDEILAAMGNYVFDADALDGGRVTRTRRASGSKHDMGGDIVPASSSQGAAVRLRLQEQRRSPAAPSATWATGATSGRWTPTSTRTWTWSRSTRSSTSTTTTGRSTRSYGPYPPAKFVHGHHGRFGEALNSAVSPGVVMSGRPGQRLGPVPRRARAQLHRGRQQRASSTASQIGPALPDPARDHRQERHRPRGRRRSASTSEHDRGPRLLGHRVGHHRRRQGPGRSIP